PGLTILRVSGFGQKGPYAGRPGFHRIGEAMSGYLSIQGDADGPPQHSGYPIADAATGLFGAVGVLIALMDRARNPDRAGQVIEVSLLESMFRIVDFLAIQYDQLGEVPGRTGNRNAYAAPGNVYQTRDGAWFSVAGTTQSIFERLAQAIGRPDLIDDPRFASNPDRVANVEALDDIIAAWMAEHDVAHVMEAMERHHVAAAPVKSIDDIFADPHVAAADMIVSVMDKELGPIRMQGVVPNLSATPGSVRTPGPSLGEDNDRLYSELLDLDEKEIEALRRDGVI
ncbi:MAG: CaiB/BaiF CoA transferase family protein, partial [Methyloligellaceae bacterium]